MIINKENTRLSNIPTSILWEYKEFDRKVKPFEGFFMLKGCDVEGLKKSIKAKGVINDTDNPILMYVHKGKALLVEGNHRLAVCIDLKVKTMPVVVEHVDKLTDVYQERFKNFVKVDNKIKKYL